MQLTFFDKLPGSLDTVQMTAAISLPNARTGKQQHGDPDLNPLIKQPSTVYLATFLVSLVLSLVAYLQNDIINRDGILYMGVARAYVDGGIGEAFQTFNWPFYGIVIGLMHQLTQLDYEHSAYLLNAVLISLACVAFVATYREINRDDTRIWIAALLILALPILNEYRDYVIRGFGYWAFLLLSVLLFIRSVKNNSLAYATLWQLTAMLAIAFRVEGTAFLAIPVVYHLLQPSGARDRIRNVFRTTYVFIACGIMGLIALAVVGRLGAQVNIKTLLLWLSYISPTAVVAGIEQQAITLHRQFEFLSSTGDAALVVTTGLAALAASKLFINAVPPYCLLAAYGRYEHWLRPTPGSRVVWLFFALAMAAMLALVASRYFLSSRYTVAAVLLLSLVTFAYVDKGLQKLADLPKRRWQVLAWALIAVIFADGVISTGASKKAIKAGSLWAMQELDPHTPWLCNEPRLRFYTQQKCELIERKTLMTMLTDTPPERTPGAMLLWVGRKDAELKLALEASNRLRLLQSLQNRRGDALMVYATSPPHPAGE